MLNVLKRAGKPTRFHIWTISTLNASLPRSIVTHGLKSKQELWNEKPEFVTQKVFAVVEFIWVVNKAP
jgi:hypothetical protein